MKTKQLFGILLSFVLIITSFSLVSVVEAEEEKAQVPTAEMIARAAEYNWSVGGETLVVMHKGKVLFEDYANGGEKGKWMLLASGSKSFVGVVALAAIDDGLIKLDDKVCESITEWKDDKLKSSITYRQLLTLTSGLLTGDDNHPHARGVSWLDVIQSPMVGEPGKQFGYGPYQFLAFGEALQRILLNTFDETYEEYMKRRIFKPLDINVAWWMRDEVNNPQIAGGMMLTSSDWAKFGELVRKQGLYNGEQLIPSELFPLLTQGTEQNPGYGLTWWLKEPVTQQHIEAIPQLQGDMKDIMNSDWLPEDMFMAAGAGKQMLYIIPSLELVIVRQAPAINDNQYHDIEFLSLLLKEKKNISLNEDFSFNFDAATQYSNETDGFGVLVKQHGKTIYENYRSPHDMNTDSHLHSATKGFWGPVVAAMIEDGMIRSYDQKVSDILTEWKRTNKKDVTIRQVMQLTSGLKNDINEIQGEDPAAPDLYDYAVNETVIVTRPGTHFQYGPVNFYVMGAFMDRLLKNHNSEYIDPLDYLQQRILDKIGVKYEKWTRDDVGNPHIPNGAYLTPRNFATWGQFVLQKGNWNGEQLIREDLMEELFEPSPVNPGFGLFMWLNQTGGWGASQIMKAPNNSNAGFIYHDGYSDLIGIMGAGKNRMYLIPSLDCVIVRQTLQDNDAFVDHTFLQYLFSNTNKQNENKDSFQYVMEDATWHDDTRDRDVPIRIYAPDLKHGEGPFPTIVFSHGGGESREAFTFLGTYWAERGYIVIFLTHLGSDRSVIDEQKARGVTNPLKLMAALDGPEKFHLRPEDVSFVADQLVADGHNQPLLKGRVDTNRIGMGGQCAGSSTALAMVGLNVNLPNQEGATFVDDRFKVAFAMSPQSGGGSPKSSFHEDSWKDINVPTLVMTGTADFNWIPAIKENPSLLQLPYDSMPPGDKYLVEIKDAQHNAFTDSEPYYPARERDPRHHQWIQQASTAFFDTYLKRDEEARSWLQKEKLEDETDGECRQEQKHKDESTYSVGVISQMTLPDKKRDVDIQLRITYPMEDGTYPIIIFSHCIRGSKENFEFLVNHWVSHGYIVIQMDSTDTPSMEESWKNRVNDIVCIIDSLESIEKQAHSIDGKMNKEVIGVGGHLVGAYASSMLAGMKRFNIDGNPQKDTFYDERVDASLQLSPQGRGQGLTEKSWEDIHVPMLVAAGSNNPSRRTSNPSEWRTEPYEFAKPGDKYLLWIEKMTGSYAGLLTGADIDEETASWIKNVTTAFWDASLKKNEEEKNKLRSDHFMKGTDGELLIKWK